MVEQETVLIGQADKEVFDWMATVTRSEGLNPVGVQTEEDLMTQAHNHPRAIIIGTNIVNRSGDRVTETKVAEELRGDPETEGIPLILAPSSDGKDYEDGLFDQILPEGFFVGNFEEAMESILAIRQ